MDGGGVREEGSGAMGFETSLSHTAGINDAVASEQRDLRTEQTVFWRGAALGSLRARVFGIGMWFVRGGKSSHISRFHFFSRNGEKR